MTADIKRIRGAISYIPPDDRDTWVRMGMAIKSELGDAGFDIWAAWSRQCERHDAKDAQDVWRSVAPNGGITIGTLFHEAKARGWRDNGTYRRPMPEELAERQRIASERAAREGALRTRERAEAAEKATAVWNTAEAVSGFGHPYLDRKHVVPVESLREIHATKAAEILGYAPKSRGKPLVGRLLVVPITVAGELCSLEMIDETGRKSALHGGAKAGGYWSAQLLPEGDGHGITLLIGEGVATVLSAREATGHPVIAALSCGNLNTVATEMRRRYPTARLVILADLGKDTGEPNHHAIEAARAVGGGPAVPDFGPNRDPAWTDFNDLLVHRSAEVVRAAIEAAEVVQGENYADSLHHRNISVAGVAGLARLNMNGLGCNTSQAPGVAGVAGPEVESLIPKAEDRPCFRVLDSWAEHQNGKLRPGVWFFGVKQGKKAGEPATMTQQWVCSPIYILAVTEDGKDNNFGRLLRFRNTLGRWREWAMPMDLLSGFGDEMRGEMLAMGVEIDPLSKALLSQYLQYVHPKRRVRCARQVGWCGDSFVLPDAVIGPSASDMIFQCRDHEHISYAQGGTLDGWRSGVAARAPGNALLVQAVSASFAGPLLRRCKSEGGGIHFTGDSSIGKTAAIDAACATWGGDGFRRSWKTTSNGLEGAAALCNDGLLALDEINECDPREVGTIVYALANGYGKQRANRTGSARAVTRWICFVLSSGERSVATHMAEGGRRAKAGQSVRLLDVPVSGQFGAWDDLHGLPTGASFSDAIKQAATTHYGHAGRVFLEKLTHDTRDFCECLERIKALPELTTEGGEGQDKRAAARFALVALAGEVATEYGITGWEEGVAIAAAAGFTAWRSLRGRGNDERRQILEGLAGFIERHGDSRFSSEDKEERYNKAGESLGPDTRIGAEAVIRDRAGWWKEEADGRVYLFNGEGLREALAGFDFNRALDALQAAGVLPPADASGKRSHWHRISGRAMRLYAIDHGKLEPRDEQP